MLIGMHRFDWLSGKILQCKQLSFLLRTNVTFFTSTTTGSAGDGVQVTLTDPNILGQATCIEVALRARAIECTHESERAGDNNCKSYRDLSGTYFSSQTCTSFCCGSCNNRYCCRDSFWRLTEDKQEDCYESMDSSSSVVIGSSVASAFILIVIFISCCVCPCCCIYKMCRKPQPVIATTTHTTVVTHTPQHYPQQPRASPGVHVQSYQGGPYPGYQPIQPGYSAAQPIQPGYSAAQPMPQAYGAQPAQPAQPMPQAYGAQPAQPAQPMPPAAAYPGYTPGPPPPYQEAMGPSYGPSPMAYSQAAFSPGQPPYPLQPPDQPYAQANAPPAEHGQPAFNPAYAHPPPKTGY